MQINHPFRQSSGTFNSFLETGLADFLIDCYATIRMFGLLNIYKPIGPTSRDCVNRLQRLERKQKLGHAGTLDPLADGVLIVAVGPAVRLVDWIHRLPKSYRTTFELGKTSPSADTETPVTELINPVVPNLTDIQNVWTQFVGVIQQTPPIYSAVQIDGKRAYAAARAGKTIEMPARTVEVFALELLHYNYPTLQFSVTCSSGTYIRSLGRDIAQAVGTEAVMTQLTRTSIGEFRVEDAIPLDTLDSVESISKSLENPARCLSDMPHTVFSAFQIQRLIEGKNVTLEDHQLAELKHSEQSQQRIQEQMTRRSNIAHEEPESDSNKLTDILELAVIDETGTLRSIICPDPRSCIDTTERNVFPRQWIVKRNFIGNVS